MKEAVSPQTKSSLLKRLQRVNDDQSWQEFAQIYSGLIRRLARNASLTEHEAEDVLQEVLISVVRNIKGFNYDPKVSSFKHWLSNLTRWRIASEIRRKIRHEGHFVRANRDAGHVDLLDRIAAPAQSAEDPVDAQWARNLLGAALNRVRQKVNEKHYQIYFLRVIEGKPIEDVCRQLKVNRGQIYLAKLRVGRLVLAQIRGLREDKG